jgi:hypothetical protein
MYLPFEELAFLCVLGVGWPDSARSDAAEEDGFQNDVRLQCLRRVNQFELAAPTVRTHSRSTAIA